MIMINSWALFYNHDKIKAVNYIDVRQILEEVIWWVWKNHQQYCKYNILKYTAWEVLLIN